MKMKSLRLGKTHLQNTASILKLEKSAASAIPAEVCASAIGLGFEDAQGQIILKV